MGAVAYAGFLKGGAGKFRKFENNEDQNKNFSTSPFSCPKSGEDQKKGGLHLDLVRFLAQNWVKAKKRGLRPPFVSSKLAQVTKAQFCTYYSMLIILSWRPKGGAMAQWPPPLNTLLDGRLWFFFVCLIRSSS